MIVGAAGHVDHGKSALVRALTGVDTDRLKEEKARGISIDLGFAYLPTNNGDIIGFVDAPGHHRFMRNMIAGAAGIDVLMLVVAADDGVMPQTREHLAIAELLGIKKCLVALTKTDLVPDDWREAMAAEVRELLAETGFAAAPVLSVSSRTGDGIDGLRKELLCMAPAAKPRAAEGRFRLAVDRCFTISGAGTIVTGPVMSGSVSAGDIVMVSPAGFSARIRAIHAQNRPAETGRCGERCALNLTGDDEHLLAFDVDLDECVQTCVGVKHRVELTPVEVDRVGRLEGCAVDDARHATFASETLGGTGARCGAPGGAQGFLLHVRNLLESVEDSVPECTASATETTSTLSSM